jgi:phosphate transport system permease protein
MTELPLSAALTPTRGTRDRVGDWVLLILAYLAAILALGTLIGIAWEVLRQAHLAFSSFGLDFVWKAGWDVNHGIYGARDFIYGTLVTGLGALVLGVPLAIAIALYLNELVPNRLRATITSLVELLAAIPSVVLGLFGIIVLFPVMTNEIRPALTSTLGWIPLFAESKTNNTGAGIMTAVLVLTIMVVPIIASVSLEVFRTVPRDLKEGALALGSTRWEMIRGVMLPASKPGIIAGVILGFGRAVGEAIAVAMVIGGASFTHYGSFFNTGDTLASRIALDFQSATANIESSSLLYLGAILLVISLIVNILAQLVIRMGDTTRTRRRPRISLWWARGGV